MGMEVQHGTTYARVRRCAGTKSDLIITYYGKSTTRGRIEFENVPYD